MANEIKMTASLSCYKSSIMTSAIGRSRPELLANMSGNVFSEGTMLVGTGATLIPMGQVTAPHWCWFHNLDQDNVITIRNGLLGADLIGLLAGEESPVPILLTAVLYAVAQVAPCYLEYLILSL